MAQRHLPVSFLMATKVAMQGKYNRMNTMKDIAAAGVMSFINALCS